MGIDNSGYNSDDMIELPLSGSTFNTSHSDTVPLLLPTISNPNIVVNYVMIPPQSAEVRAVLNALQKPGIAEDTAVELPRIHQKRKRRNQCAPAPLVIKKPSVTIVSVSGSSISDDLETNTLDSHSPLHSTLGDDAVMCFDDSHLRVDCLIEAEEQPSPLVCCSDALDEFEMDVLDLLLDLGSSPTSTDAANHWLSEIDCEEQGVRYWENENSGEVATEEEVDTTDEVKQQTLLEDQEVIVMECEPPVEDSIAALEESRCPEVESGDSAASVPAINESVECLNEAQTSIEIESEDTDTKVAVVTTVRRPRTYSSCSDGSLSDEDIYDMDELQRLLIKQRRGTTVGGEGNVRNEDELYW